MDTKRSDLADRLLRHAKRHLYGDGKLSPDPMLAYCILDGIVAMFPGTTGAAEAVTMLRNGGLLNESGLNDA